MYVKSKENYEFYYIVKRKDLINNRYLWHSDFD